MKKSSTEFFKMAQESGLAAETLMDGYVYLRWISRYLYHLRKSLGDEAVLPDDGDGAAADELIQASLKDMAPKLVKRETNTYHGKVMPLADAERLVTIGRNLELPSLPETVIPYAKARDLVLRNPDHIAVIDCPCRTSKKDHCTPVDVCLVVGEPFAGFVLDHRVANARKIGPDEAVAILRETDERGWVHSAWFKETLGNRFWVICNCCRCCCLSMKTHFLGLPMLAASGYRCAVGDDCTGCGECAGACPFGALSVRGAASIEREKCMGCGVCLGRCGAGALSLVKSDDGLKPLADVFA